jgi:putative intracellular protease/amidase
MANLAFLIDANTDAENVRQLDERFRGAGHEIVTVGGHPGSSVDVDSAQPEDFDAGLVPGGFRRNHFRTHERFLSFLRDLYALAKPLAAVHEECWVLVPADTPRATWPAVKRALIVEPGRREFADAFGTQPLKSGPPADVDGLVNAFLAQLARRSGARASSASE